MRATRFSRICWQNISGMSVPNPNASYTPGPWTVDLNNLRGGFSVRIKEAAAHEASQSLRDGMDGYTVSNANRNLIAAAPELLAAAEAKLKDCREIGDCSRTELMPDEFCSAECAALHAAVMRARGHA